MSNKLPTYGVNSPTSTPTRPEYTAKHADAPGLDALLDSVLPMTLKRLGAHYTGMKRDGFVAVIGHHGYGDNEIHGTGSTRMDAIRNAVAQATTTQEGASNE